MFVFLILPFCNLWVCLLAQMVKNLPALQETRVWTLGQEDALEKGVATHSSLLTCGQMSLHGLQSMGLQRVGDNWMTNTGLEASYSSRPCSGNSQSWFGVFCGSWLYFFFFLFYWRWSLSQEGLAIREASKECRTRGRSYLPGWSHNWLNLVHPRWSQILLPWTHVWKIPYFFFLNFLTFYIGILIPYLKGLW